MSDNAASVGADDDATFALSYAEVGATRDLTMPEGYKHLRLREPVSSNVDKFPALADMLLNWKLQEQAGLHPRANGGAAPDRIVHLRPGKLPFVEAVCKVVYVVDEPDRIGFAYGTTTHHPVRGEEAFILEKSRDGVWLNLTTFSTPSSRLAKLSGPVGRKYQSAVTRSYFLAMRALAASLDVEEEIPDGSHVDGPEDLSSTP